MTRCLKPAGTIPDGGKMADLCRVHLAWKSVKLNLEGGLHMVQKMENEKFLREIYFFVKIMLKMEEEK